MEICNLTSCTGCGMCSNLCPVGAITMQNGVNDFIFPEIDDSVCIKCNQCVKKCPANQPIDKEENVRHTYAAWNRDKKIRQGSTSGGVFSALAEYVIENGGVVVGVAIHGAHAEHIAVDNKEDLQMLYRSKYVQSNTGDIYNQIKKFLQSGRIVLFSGTPCQNHALRQIIGENDNLFQIDIICHGVPSEKMLERQLQEIGTSSPAEKVTFRYKNPNWDYFHMKYDFSDGSEVKVLGVNDEYFHLFNIGDSIRKSCHECHYTNTHRQGDITLADFWGYVPNSLKMSRFYKGVSLVLTNTSKGGELFNKIKERLVYEESSLEIAKKGNQCLREPFKISEDVLDGFWNDYEAGLSLSELSKKYAPKKFKRPSLLWLRHIKNQYKWIIKR